LRHANDTSKASRRQPVDHPINRDNLQQIDSNDDDAQADDEDEDETNQVDGPKRRQSRTSNNDIRPSQLRFYSGTWVDVLLAAKNNYRLFIHNEDPFPERTSANLEDAHGCLLDAIGTFKEENRLHLNEGKVI
jgi:hypothetical protein